MNRLWAPWRVKYVTALDEKDKGCVFCKIIREKNDKKNYIFFRSKHSFGVLNLYPYNNGHALVLPSKHVSDFDQLNAQEKLDLWETFAETKKRLSIVLKPQGFNAGMNLGRVAGAGFPGHIHIHIVPRWHGDSNFMPVIANTKVISQSLAVLYESLKNVDTKRYRKK